MRFGLRELIMLALVLMVPIAAYFLVFVPQNTAIDAANAEIEHKLEILEQLQSETARTDDLARANEEIQARIAEIEARLPTDKEVDAIVRQVTDLAIASGLTPPAIKSGKPIEAAMYMEQPLEMKTSGNFAGLYSFLQRLERLPRITRIPDFDLRRATAEQGEIVDVTFTLSIFFLEDGA